MKTSYVKGLKNYGPEDVAMFPGLPQDRDPSSGYIGVDKDGNAFALWWSVEHGAFVCAGKEPDKTENTLWLPRIMLLREGNADVIVGHFRVST
jgi:hypothetical protein